MAAMGEVYGYGFGELSLMMRADSIEVSLEGITVVVMVTVAVMVMVTSMVT